MESKKPEGPPKPIVRIMPGGMLATAGGTRTGVKLFRPWQVQTKVDPTTCPFEDGGSLEGRTITHEGGWRVITNKHTPLDFESHPCHHLIIADQCWAVEKLWELGGMEQLMRVLDLNARILIGQDQGVFLNVHVGYSAGQTLGHPLWHRIRKSRAYKPEYVWGSNSAPLRTMAPRSDEMIADEIRMALRAPESLTIFDEPLKVVAGGYRAGQCFIVPHDSRFEMTNANILALAQTLLKLVRLYNARFKSEQGLSPDYAISLKFLRGGLSYGMYVPTLNPWGVMEHSAILGDGIFTMAWPHEETVKHLLK